MHVPRAPQRRRKDGRRSRWQKALGRSAEGLAKLLSRLRGLVEAVVLSGHHDAANGCVVPVALVGNTQTDPLSQGRWGAGGRLPCLGFVASDHESRMLS